MGKVSTDVGSFIRYERPDSTDRNIKIKEPVIAINNYEFVSCKALTAVTISGIVDKIERFASEG